MDIEKIDKKLSSLVKDSDLETVIWRLCKIAENAKKFQHVRERRAARSLTDICETLRLDEDYAT